MSIFQLRVCFWSANKLMTSTNFIFNNNSLLKSRKSFSIAAATAISSLNECDQVFRLQCQQLRNFSSLQFKNHVSMAPRVNHRSLVTHELTKNLTLFSDKPRNVDRNIKTLSLKQPVDSPLVVMLSWMLAKKKHLAKYAKIYIDQGFDVLTVDVTPWQLLWPVKGAQLIAADVLKFIENNRSFDPLVIHGFSVGGYVWGEVLVHMARDMERYNQIIERIAAQVWDSAADITEIPVGLPKAIFPKNPTLQKALRNYTIYHLKTFHEQATTHYIRSSQIFHSTIVKAPALFFLSKTDPIGAEKSNLSAKEDFESAGIKVTWKCWDRSPHVLHYQRHPEEYVKYLLKHLQAHAMGRISQKSRAKL